MIEMSPDISDTQQKENDMSVNQAVSAFAGTMVLLSLVLALWVSPHFLWLTAFVGANLLQSAFTGFCPSARIFRAMGFGD